ncbi:transposase [Streptomyces sp. NPDC058751]|uniref:transposase n=1 Tax=Streptomyces sp. NPDC058751 TaxID=3346623 RepID=UPI00367C3CDE
MPRGDLTDAEWELIEPHLPPGASGPIPDLHSYFNAVMWRFRTGSPRRDVPDSYGSWSTIYDRFRMRARDAVFQPRTRPDAVADDKAYSSRADRAHLRGSILWLRSLPALP